MMMMSTYDIIMSRNN